MPNPAPTQLQAAPAGLMIPFVACSNKWTMSMGQQTLQSTASTQALQDMPIPPGGFLRAVCFDVSWTGGVGGTLAADSPYNILRDVQIADVNGNPLLGVLNGFEMQTSVELAGYRHRPSTVQSTEGAANTQAAGNFFLRLPVEISEATALGALSNQLSNAQYTVKATLAPTTTFGSGYTTAPTFTIRPRVELWTQPNPSNDRGTPQQTEPDWKGTTQQHTINRVLVSAGTNQSKILRVGNMLRGITIIARDASGVRSDAVFPTTPLLRLDNVQLRQDTQYALIRDMLDHSPSGYVRPTGVFHYSFSDFGPTGRRGDDAMGAGWLPTTQGTLLQLEGDSVTAGSLDFIVNDVRKAPQTAASRYDQRNGAYQPAV